MEIIRHGKIHPTVKVFRCRYCGCIFRANDLEYQTYRDRNDLVSICTCPECEDRGVELRPEESIKFINGEEEQS